ncbi:Tca17p NDAI_0G00230 [Naumovozyma dairenensis CBS 421]|uniref:Trafficking protein particle complex subunit n=1 Tax=Naumovozyma dairenensis (strain ATCC 10597 / BCRC 20456 / CBS 421 / NBRC 0211 / NRRL Y-12639) TaxID=1071378 RepID=G0WDD8_NAUDC|nr:hypothetical protein NDAI_0G00230 [Naumovozyma dairenensis CBS 421]CCD25799.2 hypothetical protein NDAI_0G00230 [Naumovozyma dairenensis CBS 421]
MSTIIPSFITVIDTRDVPIIVFVPRQESDDVNKVLKYNTFSNISLDYFESRLINWSITDDVTPIKLLFQLEGVSVFGMFIKQTNLKIVIGFTGNLPDPTDNALVGIFKSVRKTYIDIKCNPFLNYSLDDGANQELKEKIDAKFHELFSSKI